MSSVVFVNYLQRLKSEFFGLMDIASVCVSHFITISRINMNVKQRKPVNFSMFNSRSDEGLNRPKREETTFDEYLKSSLRQPATTVG